MSLNYHVLNPEFLKIVASQTDRMSELEEPVEVLSLSLLPPFTHGETR